MALSSDLVIALAIAINDATYYRYTDIIEDVLNSPEMQAIRECLKTIDQSAIMSLPTSVVEWVLADE